MQLKSTLLAAAALVLLGSPAPGQSLSPMHKTGATPGTVKAFRLQVANPYPARMSFVVMATNPDFTELAPAAVVRPSEIRLAPGHGRAVTVQFAIDPALKERTIGVCVLPKDLDGPLLPRVCGTYTGLMAGARSGG